MSRIFISYRRDDSAGYAGRLYDRLTDHFSEGQLFMDIDTIEPGLDFVEVIEEAVGLCDVLIVLIGKQWLTITDAIGRRRLDNPEDFVRLEIAAALDRNIRVIPVLVRGAAMPSSEDLPTALRRLARRHALELSDTRFHYDVDQLVEVLEKALAAPRRPPRRREVPRPPIAIPEATYPEITEHLRLLLVDLTGFDATYIHLNTRLVEDLGMDELDLMELIITAEDEYQLEISDGDAFDDPDSPSTEGWKLRTVQDMVTYLARRLGVLEVALPVQKKTRPAPRVGKLVCPECGLPFKRESDLEAHLANWHPASRAGKLVCPECGLPFKRQSDLERHIANWHR